LRKRIASSFNKYLIALVGEEGSNKPEFYKKREEFYHGKNSRKNASKQYYR